LSEQDGVTSAGPSPEEQIKQRKRDALAKAREAKKAKAAARSTTDDRDALIAQMAAQIANLQSAVLAQGAARVEKQEATLAPIPEASPELPPGTYHQVGVDAAGAPIMGKVRWTRSIIEQTYLPVTFTPMRSMVVAPHGISWSIAAGVEVTVPGIVKNIYDEVLKGEVDQRARLRPIDPQEAYAIAARAAEAPGTKQWSRLYRAGYGLEVRGPEPEGEPGKPVA